MQQLLLRPPRGHRHRVHGAGDRGSPRCCTSPSTPASVEPVNARTSPALHRRAGRGRAHVDRPAARRAAGPAERAALAAVGAVAEPFSEAYQEDFKPGAGSRGPAAPRRAARSRRSLGLRPTLTTPLKRHYRPSSDGAGDRRLKPPGWAGGSRSRRSCRCCAHLGDRGPSTSGPTRSRRSDGAVGVDQRLRAAPGGLPRRRDPDRRTGPTTSRGGFA